MISPDRKPYQDKPYPEMFPVDRPMPPAAGSTTQTSSLRAMWSALIALAIVAGMFVAFYDINVQLDRTHTATSAPTTTAPQTTGQGAR